MPTTDAGQGSVTLTFLGLNSGECAAVQPLWERSFARLVGLQQLCADLSEHKIDALLRKWLKRLPYPSTVADRLAGYRYDVSILQAEFSLAQVLDRPRLRRVFFEEVIRENLDNGPAEVAGQRASGLRFADVSVPALFSALLVFRLLSRGFSNRDLRDCWAPLQGKTPDDMTAGQTTYHLWRLRLHGSIERIAGTHRYRMTRQGGRTILFCTRTNNRLMRPGLAQIEPEEAREDSVLRRGFDAFDQMLDRWIAERRVPA